MKHLAIFLSLFTFHSSLFTLSASAGIPLKWTVETSRAVPAQFEAYQGETIALEASLQSYGKPLEAPSNYSLYWQTNGMGSTYWSVPCSSSATTTNVLFATWSTTNDVGAKAYNCFIGKPGTIYHAAFQLRLRPSPGALPNELPLPQKVIDFAKVTVLNPPWSGGGGSGVDTNAVRDIAREEIAPATNEVMIATDATLSQIEAQIAALQSAKADKYTTFTKEETYNQIVNHHDDTKRDLTDGNFLYSNISCSGSGVFDLDVVGNAIAEKPDRLSEKRDKTDNECHETEFVTTPHDDLPAGVTLVGQPSFSYPSGPVIWNDTNGTPWVDVFIKPYDYEGEITFQENPPTGTRHFTATRAKVCTAGESFVTHSFVTNAAQSAAAAAVSTNNPAFVSAVRSIAQPSSPSLRVYDEIRQCWWIGRMVNGVINWEVE